MRFVRPDRSLLYAPVSGTVDATYDEDWFTDGIPAHPVRVTGSFALTVNPSGSPGQACDVFAIHHHNVPDAATVTLSGSVSTTIPTDPWLADDIPYNWYRRLDDSVPIGSVVVTITGHSDPLIVGGFYAGQSYQFDSDLLIGRSFNPGEPFPWEAASGLLPPYDPGVAKVRRLSGSMILDDNDYAELQAWDLSTRNGTRPSLVIPSDDVNDAWLAQFKYEETFDTAWHYITIEIAEIPRLRWPA